MFPFTPHTTLRLDFRSGGSSFLAAPYTTAAATGKNAVAMGAT